MQLFPCLCYMFVLDLCLSGIPDCSEEDLSVATALSLRWTTVLNSHEDGTQVLINSKEVSTVDFYSYTCIHLSSPCMASLIFCHLL